MTYLYVYGILDSMSEQDDGNKSQWVTLNESIRTLSDSFQGAHDDHTAQLIQIREEAKKDRDATSASLERMTDKLFDAINHGDHRGA